MPPSHRLATFEEFSRGVKSERREQLVYEPFQWSDEIRLLKLYPCGLSSELKAELFHARLNDGPEYEAVSYTWASHDADATPCREILLLPSTSRIRITKNAKFALARLRNQDSTRILWIDSICIDQSNKAERSHQVRQMTEIYKNARRVLIYLQPACELRSVTRVQKLFGCIEHQGLLGTINDRTISSVIQEDARTFLANRWVQRMWVLQEIAMAKNATLHYGASHIDWRHLTVADMHNANDSLIAAMSSPEENTLPPVLRIRTDRSARPTDFIDLLVATRPCGATEPRDKIYAILWCYQTDSFGSLEPDYSKPIADVYREATLLCIRISNSLEVLTHIEPPLVCAESWVPDFSVQRKTTCLKPWSLEWLGGGLPLCNEPKHFDCKRNISPRFNCNNAETLAIASPRPSTTPRED